MDREIMIRGTATCDGLCQTACDWCLAGHECPEECFNGPGCPYRALASREARDLFEPEPPAGGER